MSTSPSRPDPPRLRSPRPTWLSGGGAILTLLGGLLAESSVLLLFAGLSGAWLVPIILAGLGLVLIGLTLLVLGRPRRS